MFKKLALVGALALSTSSAFGSVITYATSSGATLDSLAVSASATFTTSEDTLTITLTNLLENPTSIIQAISDLSFTFSSDVVGDATLASSSGTEVTIAGNGVATSSGTTVSTGWALDDPTAPTLHLSVLGTPIGPAHLVIGPGDASGVYSNANGSIAGNDPHNPFLMSSPTFIITNPNITADTTITAATFSFGTTAGINNVPGIPNSPDVPPGAPEPATLVLLGLGLAGIGLFRRNHAR